MRSLSPLPLLALLLTAQAAAAASVPVALKDDRTARERPTAEVLMSREIGAVPGAHVETAMIDVDGNGVGEVVVRIVHGNTCDGTRQFCRTAIFRHDGREWRRVLDVPAKSLAIGDADARGMRPIVIDGDEVRTLQSGTFRVDAQASGAKKVRFAASSGQRAREIAAVFGPGAVRLLDGKADVRVSSGTVELDAKSGPQPVYRLEGAAACGLVGYPVRALVRKEGREGVILEGFAKGDVWVMDAGRDGVRAMILESAVGPVAYAFDGRRYVADGPRR